MVKTNTTFTVQQEILPSNLDYISFNDVQLDPRPFVSISAERYTMGDFTVGGVLNLTLNGVVYGTGFGDTSKKIRDLLIATGHHGGCVSGINLSCGDHRIISSGIGYVKNITFNEGDQKNWMNIAPYTMEMIIYKDASGLFFEPSEFVKNMYELGSAVDTSGIIIKNISESVSIDIQEASTQTYFPTGNSTSSYIPEQLKNYWSNAHIPIKFDIQVETVPMCNDRGSSLRAADSIIRKRLEKICKLDTDTFNGINIVPTGYNASVGYFNFRNVKIDPITSSITVNGEYIIRPSGTEEKFPDVLVTLDTTAESNLDNGERTISLNGNIRALTKLKFSDSILLSYQNTEVSTDPIETAETALKDIVENYASGIVVHLHNKNALIKFQNPNYGDFAGRFLVSGDGGGPIDGYQGYSSEDAGDKYRLISKSFKRNYIDKSISFTLNYSSKNRCKIPNALWAEVSIDHELPSRRLVEHVVPGRGYPVTQDILCDTLDSFTITINAQYEPTRNIHKLISENRTHILTLIRTTAESLKCNNWMKVSDNETISDNGSYRRVAKFTRPSCFNTQLLTYN